MSMFKRKDRTPRIAYRQQRDGTKLYYVETWKCYESGCMWGQESSETKSLPKANKMLKEISDKEIVSWGIL